jgi:MerR family transcriptional regulator/heat shock protein HspR
MIFFLKNASALPFTKIPQLTILNKKSGVGFVLLKIDINMKRKKGFFSISAVAKMFSIHQQTIRLYEKEGLITPKRSSGNTRLFSEQDIDRLEEIVHLTHQLGINIAGVEMILKLKKQIKTMQREMNKLFDTTQQQLEQETEASKQAARSAAHHLIALKQNKSASFDSSDKTVDLSKWDVEYEDNE